MALVCNKKQRPKQAVCLFKTRFLDINTFVIANIVIPVTEKPGNLKQICKSR